MFFLSYRILKGKPGLRSCKIWCIAVYLISQGYRKWFRKAVHDNNASATLALVKFRRKTKRTCECRLSYERHLAFLLYVFLFFSSKPLSLHRWRTHYCRYYPALVVLCNSGWTHLPEPLCVTVCRNAGRWMTVFYLELIKAGNAAVSEACGQTWFDNKPRSSLVTKQFIPSCKGITPKGKEVHAIMLFSNTCACVTRVNGNGMSHICANAHSLWT